MEADNKKLSIRQQCDLLGINRSGIYYKPRQERPNYDNLALMRVVDEIYTKYPFMGTRQMTDYLVLQGYNINRHKIRKIYEYLGLRSIAPGPSLSKPHPENKIYPYLLHDVEIIAPNQIWSTDLTYIRLKHGYLYLMAIIDWYSRYVLDWELSISLEADFCVETLSRTLSLARCEIFNTDQGSQFTSNGFTSLLKNHGIKISMDGKGRALDNVFVERLWRSVKYECIYLYEWERLKDVKAALKEYFEFYNNERPHQSLGGQPPKAVHFASVN